MCDFTSLLALRWDDVNLLEGHLNVQRAYAEGEGENNPKSKRSRPFVDITPDVVNLLGHWEGESHKPAGEALVVPDHSSASGHLSFSTITKRVLYPAMVRAGTARVGPTGVDRTFHSFRHTFAKVALESGRPLSWLSRQLGHSSIGITDRCYGHWEAEARKAEAAKMEGGFGV